jgi:hypothetical protein
LARRRITFRERKSETIPDEVPAIRVEEAEQRRVVLTARLVAVASDGFQRRHKANIVAPAAGGFGIYHASLLACHEKRRLFVDEGDQADRQCRVDCLKHARYFQERGDPARVVVGARAADDRIIVRAEQQDFALPFPSVSACDEIRATKPGHVIIESINGVTEPCPFLLDICGGAAERLGDEHVALADVAGKPLDMRSKTINQRFVEQHACLSSASPSRLPSLETAPPPVRSCAAPCSPIRRAFPLRPKT